MGLKIALSSGKGGTGKTFIATNSARVLEKAGKKVTYLDCDVEEPNGHLFLKPEIQREEEVLILSPSGVDLSKCSRCGKCVDICRFNARALIKDTVLFFKNMCHICGACQIVCPADAIVGKPRKIGVLKQGNSGNIPVYYGLLETGEGGMTPRVIRKVKECAQDGINILDSPPGTTCPVCETVKDVDLCVLVTDPTPFGVNDLRLAVDMCRKLDQEPVVIINRAEYLDNQLKEYCDREELEIIGEIPDDRNIAEIYAAGDLAVEKIPCYEQLFKTLSLRMIERAGVKKKVKRKVWETIPIPETPEKIAQCTIPGNRKIKELVVISGKGGTGKTSLAACFSALAKKIVIADCDVDAADLHLILKPEIIQSGYFSGGVVADIDPSVCRSCGECLKFCRSEAIIKHPANGKEVYSINKTMCEGCGVCELVCKHNAVRLKDAVNGQWFLSDTRFGPFSHAKLGIAEENSGKLVTLVKKKKDESAYHTETNNSLIDGSPGTGCPVIASISGADYALIVTEPTVSGLHDLKRIMDVTRHFGVQSGVVVNKYDINISVTLKIKKTCLENKTHFIGVIPYDKKVTKAQMKGLSVVEYTNGEITENIKSIWEKVRLYIE